MSEPMKGPWIWRGNRKQRLLWLCTPHSGMRIVMDFVRWGMGNARPRFQMDGVMRRAEEFVDDVDHNGEFFEIRHPDARLIAAAPELLELVERDLTIFSQLGMVEAVEDCRRLINSVKP